MKFCDFKYERPNYEEVKEKLSKLIKELDGANSSKEQIETIEKINKIRNNIETESTIVSIRHSIDTTDKFYEEEVGYWDENGPLYEELTSSFYKSLVNSKFKEDLKKEYGKQLFNIAEYSLRAFSKDIIEDLQNENKLTTEYVKLIASAKIDFEGEERNLSGLTPFMQSTDREVRKKALKAKWDFFKDNEKEIDRIYDALVKVRDKIAKKLGFKNFVELGYIRMMRSDYNPQMVSNFRNQVLKYIVPEAMKLYNRQSKRLGLDKLYFYDEALEYLTGNALPKGNSQWIVDNGKKMYSELSKETKEFFDFMTKEELMDLVTKKGKAGGGYCTYMPDYKAPFIFSNFNGTSGDIDVLTHEAGHAFQIYNSSWIKFPELNFPTYESCEIHSMSMEFFTWPWMNLFFKEDTDKYKFTHLSSAIKFIPYGVSVDEFQHFVYENPKATAEERKNVWRKIEKKYLSNRDYEGIDILERGCFWFQQSHIFCSPFYYIDYTLAQICALQFWKKDRENHKKAWEDYLSICKVGGTKSFLELVNLGGLKSPFDSDCIESIIGTITDYLKEIDDKEL
ncbi:M3 family oligoendopeptidase [Clostridium fallax]|uniref:Oligoendopeptidase, M3 family n=1 Tax=Clostridium fallax TaxID=1533 RepID=A0A1M4TWH4_9CLOT|nr:M3 family oligoendopeptidase [Clostridium fallax]SHE48808.1 oligoendopeptidase, M3 family [Clostridium fallax]SQB22356.1 oligoendopeptidase [Clostridium fallax]